MQVRRIAKATVVSLCVAGLAAGCTMPRSGPTAGEIRKAGDAPQYDMHIVTVTPGVAAASRSVETLGFGADFVGAGEVSPDTIRPEPTACRRG